eukprot:scaffold139025_cov20-Tisochrysis_lutea.AAC.1
MQRDLYKCVLQGHMSAACCALSAITKCKQGNAGCCQAADVGRPGHPRSGEQNVGTHKGSLLPKGTEGQLTLVACRQEAERTASHTLGVAACNNKEHPASCNCCISAEGAEKAAPQPSRVTACVHERLQPTKSRCLHKCRRTGFNQQNLAVYTSAEEQAFSAQAMHDASTAACISGSTKGGVPELTLGVGAVRFSVSTIRGDATSVHTVTTCCQMPVIKGYITRGSNPAQALVAVMN